MTTRAADPLAALAALPRVPLFAGATPLDELPRLRAALGPNAPRLFVKRDDAIPFGFGGNKVRKLQLVAAEAQARGADTLLSVGGVQSNHMRATAAVATRLGMKCVLVANGARPETPRANALLDRLLGAELHYVASREERAPRMRALAEEIRARGGHPFEVPLGASTPLGASAFALAVGEMLQQMPERRAPDVIVHACSSGGTQAGIVAGCALHSLATTVLGVSADDPAASIEATIQRIVAGLGDLLGDRSHEQITRAQVVVDDGFVGAGYGVPSDASREAQELAARTEALFVDHTYTAKALAALVAYVRARRWSRNDTVLFWHTGGQVGLFA